MSWAASLAGRFRGQRLRRGRGQGLDPRGPRPGGRLRERVGRALLRALLVRRLRGPHGRPGPGHGHGGHGRRLLSQRRLLDPGGREATGRRHGLVGLHRAGLGPCARGRLRALERYHAGAGLKQFGRSKRQFLKRFSLS